MLFAVGLDANNYILIFIQAVVEFENSKLQTYFFEYLYYVIPHLNTIQFIFVSNQDKGINIVEEMLRSKTIYIFYYHHLYKNFINSYGRALKPLFQNIYRAKTQHIYNKAYKKLTKKKPAAAEYLYNIKPSLWTQLHFPRCYFD